MLFWALMASGQITMRKVDGWNTRGEKLAIPCRLTSQPYQSHHYPAGDEPIQAIFAQQATRPYSSHVLECRCGCWTTRMHCIFNFAARYLLKGCACLCRGAASHTSVMRAFVSVILTTSPVIPASAQETEWLVRGVGNWKCSQWLSSSANQRVGETWLEGYWTGFSQRASEAQGAYDNNPEIDRPRVSGEVARACSLRLEMPLWVAAEVAYRGLLLSRK